MKERPLDSEARFVIQAVTRVTRAVTRSIIVMKEIGEGLVQIVEELVDVTQEMEIVNATQMTVLTQETEINLIVTKALMEEIHETRIIVTELTNVLDKKIVVAMDPVVTNYCLPIMKRLLMIPRPKMKPILTRQKKLRL